MVKRRLQKMSAGIAALVLLSAMPLIAQQSSVEGVVVNRTNGQPIEGVHVRFILGIDIQHASLSYGAITDAAGKYSISAMQPGYYTVDWNRTGFLQGMGKETAPRRRMEVELSRGERRVVLNLEMSSLATISGRLVDQYGDPVPNVQIQLMEKGENPNFDTRYSGFFGIKTTDTKGQFRLFTPPGKYYIVAVPLRGPDTGNAEIRTDGTSNLVYDRTYYPSSPDTQSATLVDATPEGKITGLEIRMRSNSPRNDLTVSGVVTGIPAGARTMILHQYGTSPGRFSSGGSSGISADGKFSIKLHPGYVRLLAQSVSGDAVLQSETKEINLEAPGSDNVQLALVHQTNGTLNGALEFIGDSPSAEPSDKIRVQLSSVDGAMSFAWSGPPLTEVSSENTFRITGIPPGHYRLSVVRMPDNAYITSMWLGNLPVTEGTLDFSGGVPPERVQIKISRNGAEISGEVRNEDGELVLNPNIDVLLMPEPGQRIEARGHGMSNGKYSFKGVPPGKYRIYAADNRKKALGDRIRNGDPDSAAAESIEVVEGDRITRNLNLKKEEVNAHPKQ
jgi:protocatechuate 3,4-dioxygenase beta subunit